MDWPTNLLTKIYTILLYISVHNFHYYRFRLC